MKNKTFLLLTTLLLLASCLTSCVTKILWSEKSYKEMVRQFLVSADGTHAVFLGRNFHYVLDDNSGILKELLLFKHRGLLTINVRKTYLKLVDNDNITGYVTVQTIFDSLLPEDREFLHALGFEKKPGEDLAVKIKFFGKRYLPRDDLGTYIPTLNRTYVIPVSYDAGLIENVGKVAITPITLGVDAVLLLGKIVLLPFRGN